jgi:thiol-disulfide isomerase/thioredoxin
MPPALGLKKTGFGMKKRFLPLLVCIAFASCSSPSRHNGPVVSPAEITKELMSWLNYDRDYMVWSAACETLDPSSSSITKDEFLQQLTTGKYLPLRMQTGDSSLCYQLYKLGDSVDEDIVGTIKNKAQRVYQYYKMEGKPLAGFDFVDLNGHVYNANSTKGKVMAVNCWFIRCKPCNEEMPRLHQLVKQYGNRKDIIFPGLAFDPAADLEKFLQKTVFSYTIVPGKENYLMNELGLESYPTPIIINRQGVVEKIIPGNVNEFIDALEKAVM